MKTLKKTLSILVFCFISFQINAGVNIKNGNFYTSFTDVLLGKHLSAFDKITRTYNSKSTYIGLFGYGWGTKLETYLKLYPDGTLSIKEYGSGGDNFFTSNLMSEDLLEIMIEDLMAVLLEEEAIENTPSEIAKEIKNLKENLDYRARKWDFYVQKGLLEYATDFPIGMEWNSFGYRGNQKITLSEKGYVRTKKSKLEVDIFNKNGKMIKYDLGNGVFNTLEYIDNKLSKMTTGDGSIVTFELNDDGFVSKLLFDNREAKFNYSNSNLIYSNDAYGNRYEYDYDEKHNLIKILYNVIRARGVKEEVMLMSYHPKTSYIKSVTTRKGKITSYEYPTFFKDDGTKDPNHYATKVITTDTNGNKKTSTYEFFIKIKENGDTYTHKEINTINGIKTTRKYDDFCEQRPVEITRGSNSTYFKFNNRCLLIEKITSKGDSIFMKYHPTSEKITHVKNNESTHEFEYDDHLNLSKALKNSVQQVELFYDKNNKITSMIDSNKETKKTRTLTFFYNKIGKPIKITMENVGSINVTYDARGKIERVESEAGHKMALQVTQAFQNLLQIVKPSGVNLSM